MGGDNDRQELVADNEIMQAYYD